MHLPTGKFEQPNKQKYLPQGITEQTATDPIIPFSRRISSGNNDGKQDLLSGAVNLSSQNLEMIEESPGVIQIIALRFTNITIPQGSTISSASIQFTAGDVNNTLTNLAINAEDIDDSPELMAQDFNLSLRNPTDALVFWSPESWDAVGDAGDDQKTPDLSSIIQEIINRSGWQSGNAITILVGGVGKRVAQAYDRDSAAAALLDISYR